MKFIKNMESPSKYTKFQKLIETNNLSWKDALRPLNFKKMADLNYLLTFDNVKNGIDDLLHMGVINSVDLDMQIFLIQQGASPLRIQEKLQNSPHSWQGIANSFKGLLEYEQSLNESFQLVKQLENQLENKENKKTNNKKI